MVSINKKIKNFKSDLRRRAKRPAPSKEYVCHGGPYDGETIQLTTDKTLIFRVKDQKGYYVCSIWNGKRVEWFPIQ
jgi:hypothetical protein